MQARQAACGGRVGHRIAGETMDVLVVAGNGLTKRAKEMTSMVPIVMTFVNDPVADGLVPSLARPGGNVTGATGTAGPEIEGKRVELLKQAFRRSAVWPSSAPAQDREGTRSHDPAIATSARG
jgi:putative ABC transport system substrate-binding protein